MTNVSFIDLKYLKLTQSQLRLAQLCRMFSILFISRVLLHFTEGNVAFGNVDIFAATEFKFLIIFANIEADTWGLGCTSRKWVGHWLD